MLCADGKMALVVSKFGGVLLCVFCDVGPWLTFALAHQL